MIQAQDQEDVGDLAPSHLVVAIGASAGGIDALKDVLGALQPDHALAVVLVQHVWESERELLASVLSPFSPLPVTTIEDNAPLLPGHLHLAPPNAIVGIKDGRFRLRPPRTASERRNPIDRCFQSIADAYGVRAVGIVLSGSGTDGALGLGCVGSAGGMTMAQAPETAQATEMPTSVAAAADHVLPPVEIAHTLMSYRAHWQALTRGSGWEDRRREIQARLPELCDVLLRRTGHDFKHYKSTTLIRRTERRMQVRALRDIDAYIADLARDINEPHVLFRELLIGVTSFFREPDAFSALGERVIAPLLAQRAPTDTVRIWVSGCATGEEAYSLAMLVRECMDQMPDPPKVQIFATDVNERALVTARRGSYPQGIAAHVSPERLARFFVKRGRRYQVAESLRELCLFSAHNLISDPPFSRIDVISCRNLLIYLGSHLQKKLISVFHYALRSGGYLFLGASESLTGHGELFRIVDAKHRIAQRKDAAIHLPGQLREIGPALPHWRNPGPVAEADLGAVAQRILLDEFTPRYALVTEDGQVVFLSEGADIYVQPPAGTFSNNIMRMVRRGLSVGLRAAFQQSIRSRRAVVRQIPAVHTAEGRRAVQLTVQPMPEMGREDRLYMMVFQDQGAALQRADEAGGFHPDADSIIDGLERELMRTREDLERAVQDLEAANEELKSSNEELLSMNEELQSANEELETSKEEIQAANRALAAANADLENLLRSTRIATIFLDREGTIRSFTPAATDIYNIAGTDVGRPLAHFTHRLIDLPPLPSPAELADWPEGAEHEARSDDGRWYLRRVLPYSGSESVPGGMVVTFIEVTRQKESEDALRRSEEKLRVALSAARLGAWERDLRTGELTATPICKVNLGLPVDEPLTFEQLQGMRHPDDAERVTAAIREAIANNTDYDVEYRVVRPDGEVGWLIARGHAVYDALHRPIRMVGVTLDITERKRADEALRESGDRLKLALAAARMGDWNWDAATDMVTFSDRAAEIFGIPPGPHMTWTAMQDLLHPADAPRAAAAVEAAIATGGDYAIEYRVKQPDTQRTIWVAASGRAIYDAAGRITGMNGVVQDITERKAAEERQHLLIRELHHRVKNTLATVQAIVSSTARSAISIESFYEAFVGRIVSLAQTHTLLTEDFWQKAALHELLTSELGPYDDPAFRRVSFEGPRIELPSEAAVPIGMAIHELTTNAAKYGALSLPTGRIDVTWEVEDAGNDRLLHFRWRESDGPPVETPQHQGFGSRLLQRVLAAQLQAQVEVVFDPAGLCFSMVAPLRQPGSSPLDH